MLLIKCIVNQGVLLCPFLSIYLAFLCVIEHVVNKIIMIFAMFLYRYFALFKAFLMVYLAFLCVIEHVAI